MFPFQMFQCIKCPTCLNLKSVTFKPQDWNQIRFPDPEPIYDRCIYNYNEDTIDIVD
jgi:hypothetical protein